MSADPCGEHRARFLAYVGDFAGETDFDRENFALKREHSLKVHEIAGRIARAEGLDEDLATLTRLAALYHDVGRFEQYARFKTFKDPASVNHGLLGARVLGRGHLLAGLDRGTAVAVRTVAAVHNRLRLPERLPEHVRVAASIVRDSDKVDIMRVLLGYFENPGAANDVALLHLVDDATRVSPGVVNDALDGNAVNYASLTYVNDFKILLASWCMTFSYGMSRAIVVEREYPRRLLARLPECDSIARLRREIESRLSP